MPLPLYFPHPVTAQDDGLLAYGGDLSLNRLILAYRMGIFPWYSEGQPILWWVPKERFLINVGQLHVPKSMRRYLNNPIFEVTVDQHFDHVITRCQQIPRSGQSGTWITNEMKRAYQKLHHEGLAHSVEVWYENEIAGGLYGVSAGHIFSGESMFSDVSDASKFAAIILDRILKNLGYKYIDCQHYSRHMELLGGYIMSRATYHQEIRKNLFTPITNEKWNDKMIPEVFRRDI